MNIYKCFQESCALRSNDTAIVDLRQSKRIWTFEDLDLIIHQVGKKLSDLGISHQEPVAVLLPRSSECVIVMLALWKIDAIYVPLNPKDLKYGKSCIEKMGITSAILLEQDLGLWSNGTRESHIKESLFHVSMTTTTPYRAYPEPIAYVIHTSGTTRNGSGGQTVAVPSHNFLGNLAAIRDHLGSSRCTILVSEPTFDPSLIEIFLPLLSKKIGTTSSLVIPAASATRMPKLLFESIQHNHVDLLMMTPSLFLSFTQDYQRALCCGNTFVKDIVLGGESFPPQILTLPRSSVNLWNIYGTTECSVWASLEKLEGLHIKESVSLGQLLGETEWLIKNESGDLSDEGELWLGGKKRICYVNDENVAEKMRPTGDVVKRDSLGRIFYLGRLGDQIKRHGYRINLKQITQAIHSVAQVSQCETLHMNNPDSLVAFYASSEKLDELSIHESLQKQLPWYAIPELFYLESFPMTFHGKSDHSRLKTMYHNSLSCSVVKDHNLSIPERYKAILKRRLGLLHKPIGMEEYFLRVGGTSFMAALVLNDIKRAFDWQEWELVEQQLLQAILHEPISSAIKLIMEFLSRKKRNHLGNHESKIKRNKPSKLLGELHIKWAIDMEKCIDASPIIGVYASLSTVFIGSHSGLFIGVDSKSGSILWRQRLDGRIEGTAAVSLTGERVFVGCYDGCLYILSSLNGAILSKYKTQGEIKCKPTIDPKTGYIWFGSYDHHLYCINVDRVPPAQVFKEHLGASIFASCTVDADRRRLFVCTTQGLIKALDIRASNPTFSWSTVTEKPIFSTPCLDPSSGDIIVGCMDGCLYRISGIDGTRIWASVNSGGPIFSSPRVFNDSFLIVGSHANRLILFDKQTGEIIEKKETLAPVFGSAGIDGLTYVYASTDGILTMIEDGRYFELHLDGPVFSSPLLVDSTIYVGCRNNFLYLLHLVPVGNRYLLARKQGLFPCKPILGRVPDWDVLNPHTFGSLPSSQDAPLMRMTDWFEHLHDSRMDHLFLSKKSPSHILLNGCHAPDKGITWGYQNDHSQVLLPHVNHDMSLPLWTPERIENDMKKVSKRLARVLDECVEFAQTHRSHLAGWEEALARIKEVLQSKKADFSYYLYLTESQIPAKLWRELGERSGDSDLAQTLFYVSEYFPLLIEGIREIPLQKDRERFEELLNRLESVYLDTVAVAANSL